MVRICRYRKVTAAKIRKIKTGKPGQCIKYPCRRRKRSWTTGCTMSASVSETTQVWLASPRASLWSTSSQLDNQTKWTQHTYTNWVIRTTAAALTVRIQIPEYIYAKNNTPPTGEPGQYNEHILVDAKKPPVVFCLNRSVIDTKRQVCMSGQSSSIVDFHPACLTIRLYSENDMYILVPHIEWFDLPQQPALTARIQTDIERYLNKETLNEQWIRLTNAS